MDGENAKLLVNMLVDEYERLGNLKGWCERYRVLIQCENKTAAPETLNYYRAQLARSEDGIAVSLRAITDYRMLLGEQIDQLSKGESGVL